MRKLPGEKLLDFHYEFCSMKLVCSYSMIFI